MDSVVRQDLISGKTHNSFKESGDLNPVVYQNENPASIVYYIGKRKEDFLMTKDFQSNAFKTAAIRQSKSKFVIFNYKILITNILQNTNTSKTISPISDQNYILGKITTVKLFIWDKNGVIFTKKTGRKFVSLNRLFSSIRLFYFEKKSDLTVAFWTNQMDSDLSSIKPLYDWIIFPVVEKIRRRVFYPAFMALRDLNDPLKVISRLKKPLITPSDHYKRHRYLNYVISQAGKTIFDIRLYIYSKIANDKIAVASLN